MKTSSVVMAGIAASVLVGASAAGAAAAHLPGLATSAVALASRSTAPATTEPAEPGEAPEATETDFAGKAAQDEPAEAKAETEDESDTENTTGRPAAAHKHGAKVSAIARTAPGARDTRGSDPDAHGDAVSRVAHSGRR